MTQIEIQLIMFADAVLRQRGYQDVADQLTGIVSDEAGREPVGRVYPPLRAVS